MEVSEPSNLVGDVKFEAGPGTVHVEREESVGTERFDGFPDRVNRLALQDVEEACGCHEAIGPAGKYGEPLRRRNPFAELAEPLLR